MKRQERDQARLLRAQGKSMNEIAAQLGVSKASVSLWVRDVVLTEEQRNGLTARGFSIDAIEKRRINRMRRVSERHAQVVDTAKREIGSLSRRELMLVGAALYWGEGGKTQRGCVRVANSDPRLIQLIMRFFREVCEVPESKFRGHIHTFSHLNASAAEEYWSGISGIPLNQFYKTYSKPSTASLGKKDSLPYSTFQVYVGNMDLFFTIKGWIEGMADLGE